VRFLSGITNQANTDLIGECAAIASELPAEILSKGSASRDIEKRLLVRKGGLEPPRLAAPDPKSGASANSATFAREQFVL
jgi:hypothetical protein